MSNKKRRLSMPASMKHIKGWPREHYNEDRSPKMQYLTEQQAKHAARAMMEKYGGEIEVYRCRYCGCFHIGHQMSVEKEERIRSVKSILDCSIVMLNGYRKELNMQFAYLQDINDKLNQLESSIREQCRILELKLSQQ